MLDKNIFAFCIPLIAREKSNDWQRVLDNLQATLQSILNQIDQNFVVYIATNDDVDLPEVSNPKVTLVRVAADMLPKFDGQSYDLSNNDAGAKRFFLTSKAYEDNIKFVMPCDADDLISNTLVQFVRENPHPVGYVIRRGLCFRSGLRKLHSVP